MKDIVVIYHGDCADGFTAAWAAKKFFDRDPDVNIEYIPGRYSDHPIIPNVFHKSVYLLDFVYPRQEMEELAMQADEVIILDHHASARDDIEPLIESGMVTGIFDMDRSGAMIAWEYFHPLMRVPALVKYVQDRDLWQFKLPHSKELNMLVFSYEYTFENWHELALEFQATEFNLLDPNDSMIEYAAASFLREAKAVYRLHMKNVVELITPENELRLKIGKHIMPAYNANYFFGSDLCAHVVENQCQPVAAYFWITGQGSYVFGLRSALDGPDVSKIAIQYGGGGHKHASGFRVNSLSEL